MNVEMKVYHCDNQEENPIPTWLKRSKPKKEPEPLDLVAQFKKSPNSFFPSFYGKGKA